MELAPPHELLLHGWLSSHLVNHPVGPMDWPPRPCVLQKIPPGLALASVVVQYHLWDRGHLVILLHA